MEREEDSISNIVFIASPGEVVASERTRGTDRSTSQYYYIVVITTITTIAIAMDMDMRPLPLVELERQGVG